MHQVLDGDTQPSIYYGNFTGANCRFRPSTHVKSGTAEKLVATQSGNFKKRAHFRGFKLGSGEKAIEIGIVGYLQRVIDTIAT